MHAREALEQLRKRLAVQRKRVGLGRPRKLVTLRHRRYPDLSDRSVRAHDEPGLGRLLEKQVQAAVRELDLEAGLVGERQKRVAGAFERFVALDAKILLGKSRHAPIKPLAGPIRLT